MSADDAKETRGHGDKLARKQQDAIAALLTQPSLAKAAEAAGVAEATLNRWLRVPGFALAYRQAREDALAQTLSLLHKATSGAVATLMRNMKCGTPAVEVRAAIGILDQTMKAREALEVEARLTDIEKSLEMTRAAKGSQRGSGSRGSYG
jgi:hypothetical protein